MYGFRRKGRNTDSEYFAGCACTDIIFSSWTPKTWSSTTKAPTARAETLTVSTLWGAWVHCRVLILLCLPGHQEHGPLLQGLLPQGQKHWQWVHFGVRLYLYFFLLLTDTKNTVLYYFSYSSGHHEHGAIRGVGTRAETLTVSTLWGALVLILLFFFWTPWTWCYSGCWQKQQQQQNIDSECIVGALVLIIFFFWTPRTWSSGRNTDGESIVGCACTDPFFLFCTGHHEHSSIRSVGAKAETLTMSTFWEYTCTYFFLLGEAAVDVITSSL